MRQKKEVLKIDYPSIIDIANSMEMSSYAIKKTSKDMKY